MATEKMLIACTGGVKGIGEDALPCGMMMPGYFIPLAATVDAREQIEAMGEEDVSDWLGEAEIEPPLTGGLWVAEFDLTDFEQGTSSWEREPLNLTWRTPASAELATLLWAQAKRARRHVDDDVRRAAFSEFSAGIEIVAWVEQGALV
jgi:hypothetical protein